MFDEFKELLSIFNARSVRYLVVGGYAVSLHAQPRSTHDIAILIACDIENAKGRIRRTASGPHSGGLFQARQILSHGASTPRGRYPA
jgi:hypothetical protein